MSTTWDLVADGGSAVGPVVPVIVSGEVVATLYASWDDETGVHLSLADDDSLDDLSGVQWGALRDAMDALYAIEPPA